MTSSEYLTIRNMEPEAILNHYKQMGIECSNIAAKVHELNNEKEEHRLVVEQLEKLEDNRRAYRLIGGVLVEKTVNELLPIVQENLEGIKQIITTLSAQLDQKDESRKKLKEEHGIMTQEERERKMRSEQNHA